MSVGTVDKHSAATGVSHYDVEAKFIQRIVLGLIATGRPFGFEPLPDERWRIAAKEADAATCREVVAQRAEVFFENDQFRSDKCPAAEALWSAVAAGDVEAASKIIMERGERVARVGSGILLQRAASDESEPMTRLLLDAGVMPRTWWDDDTWTYISEVRQGRPNAGSGSAPSGE
jgi:hypothetical protein